MGITIVPLGGHEGSGINLHTNISFAGTLERTFGGDEVPVRFFAQGTEEHPDDPGPLSPEACATLADALDGLTDDDLIERMIVATEAETDDHDEWRAAVAWIRLLGDLAGLNAGLEVR